MLASHRDPESYVAGATPLNRGGIRYSHDIDIFHDRAERVEAAALDDAKALESAGYRVVWRRQLRFSYTAEVGRADEISDLEWVADSDYRFFPTIPDELFGYILHPVDLAANKVMAAAGRSEVRDLVDLLTVHEQILPLGAVIWAAVDKAHGFTPEGLIAEIRRNSNYPAAEWRSVTTAEPLDPQSVLSQLRDALAEAERFVRQMPTERKGLAQQQPGVRGQQAHGAECPADSELVKPGPLTGIRRPLAAESSRSPELVTGPFPAYPYD